MFFASSAHWVFSSLRTRYFKQNVNRWHPQIRHAILEPLRLGENRSPLSRIPRELLSLQQNESNGWIAFHLSLEFYPSVSGPRIGIVIVGPGRRRKPPNPMLVHLAVKFEQGNSKELNSCHHSYRSIMLYPFESVEVTHVRSTFLVLPKCTKCK